MQFPSGTTNAYMKKRDHLVRIAFVACLLNAAACSDHVPKSHIPRLDPKEEKGAIELAYQRLEADNKLRIQAGMMEIGTNWFCIGSEYGKDVWVTQTNRATRGPRRIVRHAPDGLLLSDDDLYQGLRFYDGEGGLEQEALIVQYDYQGKSLSLSLWGKDPEIIRWIKRAHGREADKQEKRNARMFQTLERIKKKWHIPDGHFEFPRNLDNQ